MDILEKFWDKACEMSQKMLDNPVPGYPNPPVREVFEALLEADRKIKATAELDFVL